MRKKLWHGHINRSDADHCFEDLQLHHGASKVKNVSTPLLAKTDAKFEPANHLHITAARLKNTVNQELHVQRLQ